MTRTAPRAETAARAPRPRAGTDPGPAARRRAHLAPLAPLWFALALALAGCGYQLEGTNPGLPRGAQTLALPPVDNQTFQAGLDTRLMRHLRERMRDNSSVRLATPKEADLTLEVTLKSLTTKQTSVSADGLTVELQLTLEGAVALTGKRAPTTLWREPALTAKGVLLYEKGEESRGLTTSTLNRGMDEVTREFAKVVYEKLFFNF